MLLINPKLDDIQSSEGKMNVRGRAERMAFVASFKEIYQVVTPESASEWNQALAQSMRRSPWIRRIHLLGVSRYEFVFRVSDFGMTPSSVRHTLSAAQRLLPDRRSGE